MFELSRGQQIAYHIIDFQSALVRRVEKKDSMMGRRSMELAATRATPSGLCFVS